MSFLSVIAKYFEDSGQNDILLEAETVAQGSLSGVMKGNQSVRLKRIMAEALRRKFLSIFIDTESVERKKIIHCLV